jgi:hypothetical protein
MAALKSRQKVAQVKSMMLLATLILTEVTTSAKMMTTMMKMVMKMEAIVWMIDVLPYCLIQPNLEMTRDESCFSHDWSHWRQLVHLLQQHCHWKRIGSACWDLDWQM